MTEAENRAIREGNGEAVMAKLDAWAARKLTAQTRVMPRQPVVARTAPRQREHRAAPSSSRSTGSSSGDPPLPGDDDPPLGLRAAGVRLAAHLSRRSRLGWRVAA